MKTVFVRIMYITAMVTVVSALYFAMSAYAGTGGGLARSVIDIEGRYLPEPEPATMIGLAIGAAGLAIKKLRKR